MTSFWLGFIFGGASVCMAEVAIILIGFVVLVYNAGPNDPHA